MLYCVFFFSLKGVGGPSYIPRGMTVMSLILINFSLFSPKKLIINSIIFIYLFIPPYTVRIVRYKRIIIVSWVVISNKNLIIEINWALCTRDLHCN